MATTRTDEAAIEAAINWKPDLQAPPLAAPFLSAQQAALTDSWCGSVYEWRS
jgi:hypothetical protein